MVPRRKNQSLSQESRLSPIFDGHVTEEAARGLLPASTYDFSNVGSRGRSMRNVILSVQVSLDGFIARLNGELDWHLVAAEFNESAKHYPPAIARKQRGLSARSFHPANRSRS